MRGPPCRWACGTRATGITLDASGRCRPPRQWRHRRPERPKRLLLRPQVLSQANPGPTQPPRNRFGCASSAGLNAPHRLAFRITLRSRPRFSCVSVYTLPHPRLGSPAISLSAIHSMFPTYRAPCGAISPNRHAVTRWPETLSCAAPLHPLPARSCALIPANMSVCCLAPWQHARHRCTPFRPKP